mmetsp:Transcript_7512/g.16188  ORF Transcript_7512/g.16188 Transcript_7512/m.16188 type:complete len:247 (+) Transcript_7512:104-844(+)|eukprot:CAMPEP_0168233218 /NCGR_PEP_ID=MMETSP0140_2-20121125/17602_1 /TAXON_ID=44445 /ORGANISM="Pseudo-nitzschia australis, Strain 10249 10 AB" /LENGTH=246 /DNA_ID=CAMNT_0008165903 /DNA_START=51 /DNA_END=791 /DNA_ORIENTATION=+
MMSISKVALVAALVGGASAFAPASKARVSTAVFDGPVIGAGGMADTRDPDALNHEDPRKSISAAPSFEEYLKSRDAAAAPAAAAPAAGGTIVSVLASLEGPGQVWGADGIAVGKEESDLKGYDNFSLFAERLASTGVADILNGPGPFTVFAPVDTAIITHEKNFGPFDADACKTHIVQGTVASSDVSSADLTNVGGTPLSYRRAVRKDFVNDAIIGEKTFGMFSDYPVDVQTSNGLIHAVGLSMAQ